MKPQLLGSTAIPAVQFDEHWDIKACCARVGGNRPINHATWYRGIRAGRYPKPVRIGALSRWLRSEVEAALTVMMEARHG
jgi:predicted DNA-binding transcriptional regulator AlpA